MKIWDSDYVWLLVTELFSIPLVRFSMSRMWVINFLVSTPVFLRTQDNIFPIINSVISKVQQYSTQLQYSTYLTYKWTGHGHPKLKTIYLFFTGPPKKWFVPTLLVVMLLFSERTASPVLWSVLVRKEVLGHGKQKKKHQGNFGLLLFLLDFKVCAAVYIFSCSLRMVQKLALNFYESSYPERSKIFAQRLDII